MNRKRRRVLYLFAAGLALPLWSGRLLQATPEPIVDDTLLGLLLGDLDSARVIAGRVQRDDALERDALRLGGELARRSPDAARTWFEARRAADFAARNTVVVDGWILARSEVGLCLLAGRSQA